VRPYHHGNLRAVLLAEAEHTLRERGAQGLSLRELARAAGVSHGAPRRHFSDRQALLDALAQEGFERLRSQLRAAAESAGSEFHARATATATAYVRFATRDAALLELMFAAKHGGQAQQLSEASHSAFAVMLDLIEEGQREGALEAGDPERVGTILFATMQGIAALVTGGMVDGRRADGLVGEAIERLLRGFAQSAVGHAGASARDAAA
jgi:AcrR family transcriptional regulator